MLTVTLCERVAHAVADVDRVPDDETDTDIDGVPVTETDAEKEPLRDLAVDVEARADAEYDAVAQELPDALTDRVIDGEPLVVALPLVLGVDETEEVS